MWLPGEKEETIFPLTADFTNPFRSRLPPRQMMETKKTRRNRLLAADTDTEERMHKISGKFTEFTGSNFIFFFFEISKWKMSFHVLTRMEKTTPTFLWLFWLMDTVKTWEELRSAIWIGFLYSKWKWNSVKLQLNIT